ncbi:MAG TPA: TetR/AcrR family transcriptional regulator [Candidatus Baltobacteraceae bacterium]|nr:TetR/AcrR family transcriptional regulator [Candidatus Baltobacteraceae bacterium]
MATREIYARAGSRGTTTREIADRAGVNEATLFRHFGTKVQLIEAMRERCLQANGVSLRQTIESLSGPIEEQLSTIALSHIARLRGNEDLIRVSLLEEPPGSGEASLTWRTPLESVRVLAEYMRGLIDHGELEGDATDLAAFFATLLFGYVLGHRKFWRQRPGNDDDFVRFVVRIFLRGARPRHGH